MPPSVKGTGPQVEIEPDAPDTSHVFDDPFAGTKTGSGPTALDRLRRAYQRVREVLSPVLDHRIAGPIVKIVFAYVVLVEILLQYFFGRIDLPFLHDSFLELGRYSRTTHRGVLLSGAVIGSLYSLVAMGLILVYRANRIINFAQAALGSVPAVLGLLLIALKGWNYWLVVPIVIVGAILLGGAVEVLTIRPFSKSPRLILTVATIGVGQLLLVLEFLTKLGLSGDLLETASTEFPTPFDRFRVGWGPTTFNGNHFVAVFVVIVLMFGLSAFFKYTDIGIAVRASAESGERASLLGIPVRRVSTIVWILASVLSAAGVFLRAPLIGIPLTGFVGPSILMFGLAAAVMARMESLPTAFAAGMFIGAINAAVIFRTGRSALGEAVMLIVVVVALLLQRGNLSRAFDSAASSWQAVKEVRPIPAELRGLPEVRRVKTVLGSVVALLVLTAPYYLGDVQTGRATQIVIYSMVGISLVILTGWTGQISLGQFAISGIGAAVAGGMAANHHVDFFLTLIVAGFAGAAVAILIGLPAIRIPGLFLAVTTLAFAFAVSSFVLTREFFGWLMPKANSFVERPILYGFFDLDSDSRVLWFDVKADAKYFYLTLLFLGLTIGAASAMRKLRSGRILIGVRDNSRLMQAFGVNIARSRLAGFAISGFIAAVAGALFAYQQRSVDAGTYAPGQSILIFLMTVIGGIGSIPGAILGAVYVVGVPLLPVLKDLDNIDLLSTGLGLLLLLYFVPGGLAEAFFRARDSWLRRIAIRRGIHVPSLLADSFVEHDVLEDDVISMAAEASSHDLVTHGEIDYSRQLIECPTCGARVPQSEVHLHEHFRVTSAEEADA